MKESERENIVLVLHKPSLFDSFYENLNLALRGLRSELHFATDIEEFEKILAEHRKRISVVLIEPETESFREDPEKFLHNQLQNGHKVHSLLVSPQDENKYVDLEKNLDLAGTVGKTRDKQELTFIFNRLLQPDERYDRKDPRALTAADVEYSIGQYGVPRKESTFNISNTGLFISSYQPLDNGHTFTLKITLPHTNEVIECQAETVFNRPYTFGGPELYPPGMGVRLTKVDKKCQAKIREAICSLLLHLDRKRLPCFCNKKKKISIPKK